MFTAIGWVGMILFLTGYGLVSRKKLEPTGLWYNVIQIAGALAIAISLLPHEAWPTIALELCFIAIGLAAIARWLRTKH